MTFTHVRLPFILIALAVFASACTGKAARTEKAEHDEEHPATGRPLVFGMYNEEDPLAGVFSDLRIAAKVAAGVVNEDLGGIAGRPLELKICKTDGTAPSAIACARSLIGARPVAIFGGVDLAAGAALPLYRSAGLAVIGGIPITEQEMAAPDTFRFSAFSAAVFSGLAKYAAERLAAKRVAVLYRGESETAAIATQYVEPVLQARGIETLSAVVSGDSPDAAWRSALERVTNRSRPDAILAVTAVAGQDDCVAAMRARGALRLSVPLLTSEVCGTYLATALAGRTADNAIFATPFSRRGEDEREYLEALDEYATEGTSPVIGPNANKFKAYEAIPAPTIFSRTGYAAIINAWEVLRRLTPDSLTPRRIIAAFRGARDRHAYMARRFTCAAIRPADERAICDSSVRIERFHNRSIEELAGPWIDAMPVER
jgi:branched-chain amino acid transport system substrate-binding protein